MNIKNPHNRNIEFNLEKREVIWDGDCRRKLTACADDKKRRHAERGCPYNGSFDSMRVMESKEGLGRCRVQDGLDALGTPPGSVTWECNSMHGKPSPHCPYLTYDNDFISFPIHLYRITILVFH